jgi:hypothetical protein
MMVIPKVLPTKKERKSIELALMETKSASEKELLKILRK